MRVENYMSTPVVITQRNVSIKHLNDMFVRKGLSAAPVLEEDGTITGIVTSSDLLRLPNEANIVQDIMSDRVHIVMKNNRLKDAASIMVKNGVHHLVVMEEGVVVGMLSSLDIAKVFSELV
jgi:predicted transcriptional regulator